MDIERGCIELLLKEVPYEKITIDSLQRNRHDYKTINKTLFQTHAHTIFPSCTEDECLNHYSYLQECLIDNHEQSPNLFRFIMNISERMLTYQNGEIKCKIDQLLRWREVSFQLGQDIFTCSYLAKRDLENGKQTKYFAWIPIIRSDDQRLHNILDKGMAENHFHLAGSTKVFELNWVSLMNSIEGRVHDFKKIDRLLQEKHVYQEEESNQHGNLYHRCQLAALYRIYLFSVLKKDAYIVEQLESGLLCEILNGFPIEAKISEIQDKINLAKQKYGARLSCKEIATDIDKEDRNQNNGISTFYDFEKSKEQDTKKYNKKYTERYVLDYTIQNDTIDINNNDCRLLSGERRFLYECFKACVTSQFTERQKNYFYRYLSLRTDFRSELIQVNRHVGFANFSNYQDRKEFFIEGMKSYEYELARLSLNASFHKQNIASLEARLCPANTSKKLYKKINIYNRLISRDDNLLFVLHYPKSKLERYCMGEPRNYKVRNRSYQQTKAIAALLEKGTNLNRCLRGIDACSNEYGCRPEVFAQYFRYLSDISFSVDPPLSKGGSQRCPYANLHLTYHAGEDFQDIVDGLRAIEESILFCGLGRGSRIGHALALGIAPENYYQFKGYAVIMPKQDLLDDIMWILIKIGECFKDVDHQIESELKSEFEKLFSEIYGNSIGNAYEFTLYDYYNSWKLRGDYPKNYRLDEEEFREKLSRIEIRKISRYEFNRHPAIDNNIRINRKVRTLYRLYHYSEEVRKEGAKMVRFKVNCNYIQLVRKLQDHMIRKLVSLGIGIETNPSSNYLIGTIKKYEEHPILRFNSRKLANSQPGMSLCVSINTDDQGVFDTLLENEYALMTQALKKMKNEHGSPLYDIEDIYEWIDYVRQMGMEQVFENHTTDI